MADGTKIEWSEATWNPITGCSLASPGCTNCYAMQLAGTRLAEIPSRKGLTKEVNGNHVWTGEVRFNEQWLDQPLRWKKPRMIFVCAHGDLFHESVPDHWIDRVFAVMALCPQHTFQVLTKRSARMREYLGNNFTRQRVQTWCGLEGLHITGKRQSDAAAEEAEEFVSLSTAEWPLPNVWLGVSVEDQQRADERIPELLATPAAIRWISAEPLLGPVELCDGVIDWVVVGGESGRGARPMHPDWARSLRDQCAAAGVPFFFKQWGQFTPGELLADDGTGTPWRSCQDGCPPVWVLSEYGKARKELKPVTYWNVGKKRAGRLLDGVEHNAMPTPASCSAAVGRKGDGA